jgi:energy-coupling factor transport system ATP-binding protein
MKNKRGLGRLSPTARLIVFVVLSTLFTLSSNWIPVLISLSIGIILLVWGGKYPRAALVGAWSAFVLTFVGNALFAQQGDLLFRLWVFRISEASLLKGLRLGLRITAMILPAVAFIAVTPRHEYLDAFRGLRIPPAAEMYLTIVLRYVDILWYEIQVSMKAMAMRGVNWQGGIRDRISAFRSLMLPLIFRVSEHIDGQALAIDNRGGITARGETLDVSPGQAAVSMQDVYVRYRPAGEGTDDHALSAVDLQIEQAKTTVLMGRTGAGKTSTLLLCTGLIPHSVAHMRGEVEIFGQNSKQSSLGRLGRLARIVFPSAVQGLVGLTVEDELQLSLRVSTLPREDHPQAMSDALQMVGLDESFLPRLTLGLSGGEMQRVALASAIVARPLLLALDDVTVQLDPRGKQEVVRALHTLLEQRITAVMTDPYVSLLDETGDRFILLEKGRLAADDDTLTSEAIEHAGLRLPQMRRLSRALGIDLPKGEQNILAALRGRVGSVPGDRPAVNDAPGKELVVGRGLSYTYPDGPTAIDGLDITLYQGEFVAILGANGSGKTTTALLLAQAMPPTAGEILIEGVPADLTCHRGCIAYVFQEPINQMVTMKVAEELAFGPRQLGWDSAEIETAVEREAARFDLDLDEIPLHLSPAGARKLAIAANLTMNPQVMILDEPTNNLDERDVTQLVAHLESLRASGMTVVVITHDVEVACAHADRVIVMHKGRILAQGPTREVMAQPDVLSRSDVVVPPVVSLSLALWPDRPPRLTVDELAAWLQETAHT